ncbi:PPE family protein [Mycobacterium vicinigordonae]|uniref:PPE family protein n=1 Tax=Mycobacterium vicinigordonae TaxID=1719132 RepID=A0A7D6HV20_9MYCO|nr:PPE family protein [Mycobacterium vicinigordonae]QLL08132.1 PPE family protein [Mycobacterium vicinigordonae]
MTSPHFAWLPPEINSALMFAGPGAGPLLAAASAWSGLAEDLASSVASFTAVIQELTTSSWLGPSAAAMMTVATQYTAWLSAAAVQADLAAAQAAATVAAFESAVAAMVQPAVVAANRGLIQMLATTNFFGMNWPAIMDTEAAYEQMWALDVAAMANYHFDASAALALLAPWQQVLRNLGIDVGAGGVNFGFGNTGFGNIGNNNAGNMNVGLGNSGIGNIGIGNTGNNNVGIGNTGNNNLGFGNFGNNNFGFANTGSANLGFGLTGDHEAGFGGFNSGSGNVGFGNSGTGNTGFFNSGTNNSGVGNSGMLNAGFGNSGSGNTSFGAGFGPWASGTYNGLSTGSEAVLTSTAHYATGGLSTLGTGLLNSALASTGGLHLGLAGALSSGAGAAPAVGAAGSAASIDPAGPSPISANATSSPAANSGLRTSTNNVTGFYSPHSDPNARAGSPNIPKSGFYPEVDRGTADQSRVIKFPVRSE